MERGCKYCGELKPVEDFVSLGGRQCKACRSECDRLRYWRDRAKIKERVRLYRETHRVQVLDGKKRYYQENKERLRGHTREYYKKHREKCNQRQTEYRKNNPQRRRTQERLWALANPEKYRAGNRLKAHRRRGLEQGAEGSFTAQDIITVRESQRGRCFYCGVVLGDDYHIDHFVPLSMGGNNNPSNLRLSCPKCNLIKGAKNPQEFIQAEFGRLF